MNKQEEFKYFKSTLLDLLSHFINKENLKRLIEKAETIESLIEILKSDVSFTKKEVEIMKELIKDKIKSNPNFGPQTKKVFEDIVSSNIHPFHMYEGIIIYGNTHDIRL